MLFLSSVDKNVSLPSEDSGGDKKGRPDLHFLASLFTDLARTPMSGWPKIFLASVEAYLKRTAALEKVRRSFLRVNYGIIAIFLFIFLLSYPYVAPHGLMWVALGTAIYFPFCFGLTYLELELVRNDAGRKYDSFLIPNMMTYFRMLSIPILFGGILLVERHSVIAYPMVIFYTVLASSDLIDGTLSRATHQTSDMGRLMDPFVDILFNSAAVLALSLRDAFPWWLSVLVLFRYLSPIIGGFIASVLRGPVVVKPTWIGKVTGFVIAFVIGAALCREIVVPTWLTPGWVQFGFYTGGILTAANAGYVWYRGIRYLIEKPRPTIKKV